MDFEDPLNVEAAKQHAASADAFQIKARDYINKYARS